MTGSSQTASVFAAARLLAEWHSELGYLQSADAAQILLDAFGDQFVVVTESGQQCTRCDLLEALRLLVPEAAWASQVACWEPGAAPPALARRPLEASRSEHRGEDRWHASS